MLHRTRKDLKTYNLTTTNATLMRLIKIMYLHKTFNLAEDWGVTYQGVGGVIEKPVKMSQKTIFWLNFDHFLIAQ